MNDLTDQVRERYGAAARRAQGDTAGNCGCGCGPTGSGAGCCGDGAGETAIRLGYSADDVAKGDGSNLGLGCGNPLGHAAVQPGETVLDLGSGAGIDAFLAAREVGPEGRVIGVDMTASMLSRARANSEKGGFTNVEFRLGEIENLPVADASVDLVISNCVVNLSPTKDRVFAEAYRALRPGGRMLVSDLVLTRPLTPEQQRDVDLYVGCVAGAALKDEYLGFIRAAGFHDVDVVNVSGYEVGMDALPADSPERNAFSAVVSVQVRARKG
jgi:SAM-dependent methyltransferase